MLHEWEVTLAVNQLHTFPTKPDPTVQFMCKGGKFSVLTDTYTCMIALIHTHTLIQFIGILQYLLMLQLPFGQMFQNKKKNAIKQNKGWNGDMWNNSRSMTSVSRSSPAAPHTHPAALLLLLLPLHLILPEEFNLLPRVPLTQFL